MDQRNITFCSLIGCSERQLMEEVQLPVVTVTLRQSKDNAFKTRVLAAVHSALTASGVPELDRFQRLLELSGEDVRFDDGYPDLTSPRTDDFVLIEVLLSTGRGVKVKRKIAADIIDGVGCSRTSIDGMCSKAERFVCDCSSQSDEVNDWRNGRWCIASHRSFDIAVDSR
jgi:hypothetical protein